MFLGNPFNRLGKMRVHEGIDQHPGIAHHHRQSLLQIALGADLEQAMDLDVLFVELGESRLDYPLGGLAGRVGKNVNGFHDLAAAPFVSLV